MNGVGDSVREVFGENESETIHFNSTRVIKVFSDYVWQTTPTITG